jgi:cytochrome c556
MKSFIRNLVFAAVGAAVLGLGFVGNAAADAGDDIKYRQKVMHALGAHAGAVGAIVKGKTANTSHLSDHADAMAAIGRMAADIFPKGSGDGDTAALPNIWEKPAKFKAVVDALAKATADFAAAAKGNDVKAAGAAIGAVFKSCGGCHKVFRKKKK